MTVPKLRSATGRRGVWRAAKKPSEEPRDGNVAEEARRDRQSRRETEQTGT